MYVKIAVNIPQNTLFTYSVPESLRTFSAIGKRALVPFGKRQLTGYIISFLDEPDFEDIRDLSDILDTDPLFSPDNLAFYSWAASYYHYPLGKALHDILPGGIDWMSDQKIKAVQSSISPSSPLPERQKDILDLLTASPQGISLRRLQKIFTDGPIRKDLTALLSLKCVTIAECLKKPVVQKKRCNWFLSQRIVLLISVFRLASRKFFLT